MPDLFTPIDIGRTRLSHRAFMAPLTRTRATHDHVPHGFVGEYYAQRAEAGLIISEATGISRQGLGMPYAPGIWNEEQTQAWSSIVSQVKCAGGHIYCQLWHMGRLVDPSYLDGAPPVSASTIASPIRGRAYHGRTPPATPVALSTEQIAEIVRDYAAAARNAISAGFDGVQLHAANGYLIDQFLRDSCNLREDEYGGSPENRIRFLSEVTEAVANEIGPERTAIRLSPNGDSQGVNDSAPHSLFATVARILDDFGLAFLELREPGFDGKFGAADVEPVAPTIRQHFKGPLVLNSDYSAERADEAIRNGDADAISFGRPFIANPDFVKRIQTNTPLQDFDPDTLYAQGREGYLDYPTAEVSRA